MPRSASACWLCLLAACAPTLEQRRGDADRAMKALQAGEFRDAEREAGKVLASDRENPFASLVRAVAIYERSAQRLALDLQTAVLGAMLVRRLNASYLAATLAAAERALGEVEADLALAEAPGVSLELCPACWTIDWNGSGRIERFDRLLLEVEEDADGHPIPEADPRRRPTFRFDEGDVAWARAFVSFERAALDLALAFDWSALGAASGHEPRVWTFPLVDRERIDQARSRVLAGLDHSDRARRAYLAEVDDDREWVPNPRQRSHPVPLPVDDALYATWQGLLADVRRVVDGEEGLCLDELAALAGEPEPGGATGCLDVGAMFARPRDLVVDARLVKRSEGRLAGAVTTVLGPAYVRRMPPSPALGRLARMKAEIDRQEEKLGRKLRYLLWLN